MALYDRVILITYKLIQNENWTAFMQQLAHYTAAQWHRLTMEKCSSNYHFGVGSCLIVWTLFIVNYFEMFLVLNIESGFEHYCNLNDLKTWWRSSWILIWRECLVFPCETRLSSYLVRQLEKWLWMTTPLQKRRVVYLQTHWWSSQSRVVSVMFLRFWNCVP